jgi:hypothetical protein
LPDQVEGVRVIVQARESHFQDSAGHSG